MLLLDCRVLVATSSSLASSSLGTALHFAEEFLAPVEAFLTTDFLVRHAARLAA